MCFKSKATTWGCQHEDQACRKYESLAKAEHIDFCISKSGLVIHESYPFMGASPDGTVICTCCGFGVLEIKCPYSCCDTSFGEKTTDDSTFYLVEQMQGKLSLNVYHSYYFQVQAQLKFCNAKYCDFVVYNMKELFVQRVYLDEPFITIVLEMCKEFIIGGILPELLAKFYSTDQKDSQVIMHNGDNVQDPVWCYCQQGETGETIGCDNPDCNIQWFHTACLHITKIPKGKWFCPDCSKSQVAKKN